MFLKFFHQALALVAFIFFTGCATVQQQPPFDGGIKTTGNSLLVLDSLILDSGSYIFEVNGQSHTMVLRQEGLNFLELPPGELSFKLVSTLGYRFKPSVMKVNLKPNTIHYLGKSFVRFDFDKSLASFLAIDAEDEMKQKLASKFPNILNTYGYEKSILKPMKIDYGQPSDYDSLDIPKPTEEYAVLVIYRYQSGEGDWVTSGIHIDDTRIVGLEVDDYTWIKIKPGDYQLKAHLGLFQNLAAQRTVTLEAGQAYFYHFGYGDIGRTIHRKKIPEAVERIKLLEYDEAAMEVFKPKEKKRKRKSLSKN